MTVYRFMSSEEALMLITGQTITNNRKHNPECSTSIGSCFGIGNYETALEDYRHLKGIVASSVLLVGDISNITLSKGRYVDYSISDLDKGDINYTWKDEGCLTEYSLRSFTNLSMYLNEGNFLFPAFVKIM